MSFPAITYPQAAYWAGYMMGMAVMALTSQLDGPFPIPAVWVLAGAAIVFLAGLLWYRAAVRGLERTRQELEQARAAYTAELERVLAVVLAAPEAN